MDDTTCRAFLQWALPRMGMQWKGFRKVRRQVCRRIRDRMATLGVDGTDAYRDYLEAHPEEWETLAVLCRVTISRFSRDRGVFRFLAEEVLPELARQQSLIRAWSAGCASGEEPYTLSILWRQEVAPRFPGTSFEILATDVDPVVLERAREGEYQAGTLRELSDPQREAAFVREGEVYRLRSQYRTGVHFLQSDLRQEMPEGPFDLILCRNLAFTYFDAGEQGRILTGLLQRLEHGGGLVLGAHETLPAGEWPLERWSAAEPVFRKD